MIDYRPLYTGSHALVMGIDEYRHLPPLSAAVKGAQDLADALYDRFRFKVTLLRDGEVTRHNVFDWLNTISQETYPDDRVLIYFAGHGLTRGSGIHERGYLALVESQPGKWHTTLAMDDIIEEASFVQAKHLLYVLDCCFGGLALQVRAISGERRELDYYLTRPVRYAISAGGREVVDDSLAPDGEHSLFSYHLLGWLTGEHVRPPGGIWRARELGNYLERAVAQDRRSGHKPNHNYLPGSGDGDFIFDWQMGPRLATEIEAAVNAQSEFIRRGAVDALFEIARSGDPDKVAYATEWLKRLACDDPDMQVREVARHLLENMGVPAGEVPLPGEPDLDTARLMPDTEPLPLKMPAPPPRAAARKRGLPVWVLAVAGLFGLALTVGIVVGVLALASAFAGPGDETPAVTEAVEIQPTNTPKSVLPTTVPDTPIVTPEQPPTDAPTPEPTETPLVEVVPTRVPVEQFSLLLTLSGHTKEVHSVAWSPDGTMIASGAWDATAMLWDVETGSRIRTLLGHTGYVSGVAWSPDGSMLATASLDDTVILWDVSTGGRVRTLTGHTGGVECLAWSPDGALIASGSQDHRVIVWDAAGGVRLHTLERHSYTVESLAWSPDSRMLASGSGDRTVIIWDVEAGEPVRTLPAHADSVYGVAWSPDGNVLATVSTYRVLLWDTGTGEQVGTLAGQVAAVCSLAWSPDGETLAAAPGTTVILWDVATGGQLNTLTGQAGNVHSLAWSPDGTRLAATTGLVVVIWGIAP